MVVVVAIQNGQPRYCTAPGHAAAIAIVKQWRRQGARAAVVSNGVVIVTAKGGQRG